MYKSQSNRLSNNCFSFLCNSCAIASIALYVLSLSSLSHSFDLLFVCLATLLPLCFLLSLTSISSLSCLREKIWSVASNALMTDFANPRSLLCFNLKNELRVSMYSPHLSSSVSFCLIPFGVLVVFFLLTSHLSFLAALLLVLRLSPGELMQELFRELAIDLFKEALVFCVA